MKSKKILLFGLQLLLIIAAAIGFYSYTNNEVKPHTAYVFTHDMEINTQVTEADVKPITVPLSALTNDFALSPDDILGKYVQTKVYANNFVYDAQLIDEGQQDPFESMDMKKLRKISMPISYVDGFGGNLKRGDKIDLIYTGEGTSKDANGNGTKFQYSKVFLQDVYVYSVTTSDGFEFKDHSVDSDVKESTGEEISTSASSDEMAVLTLAVDLKQAEEISARNESGVIRVVGRFQDNESYETLGYVLGEYSKVYTAPASAETDRTTINQ